MKRLLFSTLLLAGALASASAQYVSPLQPRLNEFISSGFGMRNSPMGGGTSEFHFGIDIAVPKGTEAYAIEAGSVASAGHGDPVFGNYVILRLDFGVYVLYGHLSRIYVDPGDKVAKGGKIGLTGSTGRSTGPHLHLQMLLDPMAWLPPSVTDAWKEGAQ